MIETEQIALVPPGELLEENLGSVFFEKEIINNQEVVLSITEPINFFLSPKVQTIHYCKSTGELKVELYVAISSKVTINEECPITVYMNEEKFYVTYNAP